MIGVMDSGLGGLLLLEGIHKSHPDTDVLFYGDIEHMPYGDKSDEELKAIFGEIVLFFRKRHCTDLIVACNTMCSAIDFTKDYGLRVHDIITKTVAQVDVPNDKKILVLSTTYTKMRGRYRDELEKRGYDVLSVSLPKLALMIEKGEERNVVIKMLFEELDGIEKDQIGAIILGCTHYPVYKDFFKEYYDVPIFDSRDLTFSIEDKKEEGAIILHTPKTKITENLMKHCVKASYRYD